MRSPRSPAYDRHDSWRPAGGKNWRQKPPASLTARFTQAAAVFAATGVVAVALHHHYKTPAAQPSATQVAPSPAAPEKSAGAAPAPVAPLTLRDRISHVFSHPARTSPAPAQAVPPDIDKILWKAAQGNRDDYEAITRIVRFESNFKANPGRNPYSTGNGACGLMQMLVDSTLPELARRYGAQRGYGNLSPQGLTAACRDPQFSADMGVELLRENRSYLMRTLGRPVSFTDLGFANVLGKEGARQLVSAHDAGIRGISVGKYVDAASIRGNPAVFTRAGGHLRTVAEAYDYMAQAMDQSVPGAGPASRPAVP